MSHGAGFGSALADRAVKKDGAAMNAVPPFAVQCYLACRAFYKI